MISSTDSGNYTPVVGYAGAVDTSGLSDTDSDGYIDDTYVAVATESLETSTARNHNSPLSPLNLRGGWGELIMRNAQATSISATEDGSTTTTNYCTMDGVTTAQIATDGSFEAFPQGTNSSTFYLYATDCTTLSDAITDTVNTALVYLRQVPQDVTGGPTGQSIADLSLTDASLIWSLGQDRIVPIVENSGTFLAAGNYADYYEADTASGATQIAFGETSYLSKLHSTDGLPFDIFDSAYWFDETSFLRDSGTATVEDTEAYNLVKKSMDDKIRFVRKPIDSKTSEKIYYALTDDPDSSSDSIQFFDNSDSGMSTLMVADTPIFDAGSSYALALFEDQNGDKRLRAIKRSSGSRFGGSTALTPTDTTNTPVFVDMVIYHEQPATSVTDYTYALLLDQANNMVWQVKSRYVSSASNTVTSSLTTSTNGIPVGTNPQSIVLNEDKTKAYVLNQDDATISVITIMDGTTVRAYADITTQTINLSDYLNGKEVTLTPNQIAYHQNPTTEVEYLIVSDQSLKGSIVVDLSTATLN